MSSRELRSVPDDVENHVPPRNIQAEEAVLSACLQDPDALAEVIEVVSPEDFYVPKNAQLFAEMRALFGRGDVVDAITIATQIGPKSRSYIASLITDHPIVSGSRRHAELVAEAAIMRSLLGVSRVIQEIAMGGLGDVASAIDKAESAVFAVRKATGGKGPRLIVELLEPWLHDLEARGKEELAGISTGFGALDDMLGGLRPGQLVVVAARPQHGKSALLGDFTLSCAQAGGIALVASVEMSSTDILNRYAASVGRISLTKLTKSLGHDDEEWQRVSSAAGKLAELPIYIDDDPDLTMLDLRAKARRLMAKRPLSLIVVDYIQLMETQEKNENRQVDVAEISRGLKLLARELEIPVVAAAQLNRNLEYREDKRPRLADIRESGAIENDADVVLGLYRDFVYNKKTENPNGAEVIILKQRQGPIGTVDLTFIGRFTHFLPLADVGEPKAEPPPSFEL